MASVSAHTPLREAMQALTNEYLDRCALRPTPEQMDGVKRGLRNPDGTGVLAGVTRVSQVVGTRQRPDGSIEAIPGRLLYRGIDIEELASHAGTRPLFEEACWLLLLGRLPTGEELREFCETISRRRTLAEGLDTGTSPDRMNRMARAVLAMHDRDDNADSLAPVNLLRQSFDLIAAMPGIMLPSPFLAETAGLSTAAAILALSQGKRPTKEEVDLLDLCLMLHADHSSNCSTFACRVISSSGADSYAAISGAIGALKGHKHGGANRSVARQMQEILAAVDDPTDEAAMRDYLGRVLECRAGDGTGLIYGLGHAVYTISDPRAVLLKQMAAPLAAKKGFGREFAALEAVEHLGPAVLAERRPGGKPVCANVDLYSGLIYRMLGFPDELITPLFAVARTPGWCANRMEEVLFSGRIIRPGYRFIG